MVGSAEICRSIAFWGVAAVLFSLFAAIGAIFVYRVYASLSKMAKRIGLAAMALLGLLSIGATIGGTPTLEDKERSCQENNAWANVFGFGTNGVQNMGGFLTGLTGFGNGGGQGLPALPAANCQLPTSNGVPVVAGTITAEDCAAGYVLSTAARLLGARLVARREGQRQFVRSRGNIARPDQRVDRAACRRSRHRT